MTTVERETELSRRLEVLKAALSDYVGYCEEVRAKNSESHRKRVDGPTLSAGISGVDDKGEVVGTL